MFKTHLETTVTERGQTAIPARIRRRYGIKPGQKLEWVEAGNIISLLPGSKDPIRTFRGSSKGWRLTPLLLKARRDDARYL